MSTEAQTLVIFIRHHVSSRAERAWGPVIAKHHGVSEAEGPAFQNVNRSAIPSYLHSPPRVIPSGARLGPRVQRGKRSRGPAFQECEPKQNHVTRHEKPLSLPNIRHFSHFWPPADHRFFRFLHLQVVVFRRSECVTFFPRRSLRFRAPADRQKRSIIDLMGMKSVPALFSAILAIWFLGTALPAQQPAAPSFTELTLEGTVRGSQNQSYIKVPFSVPAGAERVTITFEYTGKDQHTALDLGMLDPAGLRCWSGGNKSMLTVGLSDATPSCLPGAIPPGTGNVLIGVPNIRPAGESHYTTHVYLSFTGAVAAQPGLLREPLRTGPAWFRGDLHMHTAHSDGQCPSQSGKMVPCPVYFTVDAAARRGLDFIAITDHNASSQYDAMRELQPYFDKVLLIPGREITTFQGHINFLGSTDFIDFRLDGSNVPDVNT